MGSDSHADTTWRRVAELLDGRAIDFLFIDGDHSCDGVWQDFKMYSSLVAPGGLIAFHDICQSPAEWTKGVAQFLSWQDIIIATKPDECV